MLQLLSQRRAKHALEAIQAFAQTSTPDRNTFYLSAIKSVPIEMRTNGLGQAMAMALSQSKKGENKGRKEAYEAIYNQFRGWLCNSQEPDTPFAKSEDFMQSLCAADQKTYLTAQAEALAYAEWLKKFAHAFLVEAQLAPDPAGEG
ncbi:MAG: type III-B CRISPR module-associated protein Cmr5, partial [Magnetococcales bacterium]|nr:type III-B CRISPR module-associated protein Cmr5 [Magnetococcales bacterium]